MQVIDLLNKIANNEEDYRKSHRNKVGRVMKTITFKELIELIDLGKSPEIIYVAGIQFSWNGYKYTSYGGVDLKFKMQYNDLFNTTIKIPTKPLLTDQEKAYLKAVIEPFKDEVDYIIRNKHDLQIMGEDDYYIVKIAVLDMEYSDLELLHKYTLKELELD